MAPSIQAKREVLDPGKFDDPVWTLAGERRARVALGALKTLWINTGSLCNLTCANCYIESSPTNDRLAYIRHDEVTAYLDEIAASRLATEEIGFTGGEPFMNPDFVAMVATCLARGYRVLVLTNAMRPMMKVAERFGTLATGHGERLKIRVSLDHYAQALHETERGPRTWQPALTGLKWLAEQGFTVNVAGRMMWGESEQRMRIGYARLFADLGVAIDAFDPAALVLFPEMDEAADTPEITESCWDILGKSPDSVMCAASRMVVKRKGAAAPTVVPCTLLPYDERFELGETLAGAAEPVPLNHPHCARFCVLGGASCSAG